MIGREVDVLTGEQRALVRQWAAAKHTADRANRKATRLLDQFHNKIIAGDDDAARAVQARRADAVAEADSSSSIAAHLWHALTGGAR